ncbi:hypothetical protein PTSG_12550 [Salpingoeca rosetta]|uniref:Uncharacterized protein n=1 Tax=Salpingoeca rosetta (strain ATCC 50818 / BSB-021) TaxID=946362 RepID=F2UEC5_SALR5|nr:uncharacterized protein PTSG_12550 [Salpingoeca rosetta]EGD74975.1 hypothetical protein PTSG_12550 [Salpingoeca rosetta]|eukprot:XP_004992620.1 hypothetical protein PTSG_12550 [Salpingoeca rosetta]
MEWTVTYLGSTDVRDLDLDETQPVPDLTPQLQQAVKEIRKAKRHHDQLAISVNPDCLCAQPRQAGGPTIYQPIGKIVFVNPLTEGAFKKAYMFAYIATTEGTRVGGPHPKYVCHAFKCKSDPDANAIAFAAARTMSTNARRRPLTPGADITRQDLESAVLYWNANSPKLFHLEIGKDDVVSGNVKISCQVDASLKTVSKVVRLTTSIRGDELTKLLAEKFNLGAIDASQYAVFDSRDTGEQNMLEDDDSPIFIAMTVSDPSEVTFLFRKLPPGLVRVSRTDNSGSRTNMSASNGSISTTPSVESGAAHHHHHHHHTQQSQQQQQAQQQHADHHQQRGSGTLSRQRSQAGSDTTGVTLEDIGGETSTDELDVSPLGPLLPYHEADEDLLLNVMITRQSGNLGFKLTPAYLLQMCIAYRSLKDGPGALRRLLTKIAAEINKVVRNNPDDPDMLLFWASNTLKLMGSLLKDASVFAVFTSCAKQLLEDTVSLALRGITRCAVEEDRKPYDLEDAHWTNDVELRAVIVDHYRTLDQNMSHESLREVVNKITAAMPSPQKQTRTHMRRTPQHVEDDDGRSSRHSHGSDTSTRLGFSSQQHPMTSTPVSQRRSDDMHVVDSMATAVHGDAQSDADVGVLPSLPPEWEELVDHETKHRFFANHKTRQTSWTDPRDKLITVNLIKGDKGLGLGISGAKRTRDGRLVLGIFVSSLVPGSAADVDGTLRDGDEILEVNGHSLIGVNREGAINFLKQVRHGETVTLLVSQEPSPGDHLQRLRHTQL